MKIAYLLLVHQSPHLFKRIFRAVYDPQNTYVVHIDKKSDISLHQEIRAFVSEYPNARIMRSYDWVYCGYSPIEIHIQAMKDLLDEEWDFFINLSGQDFPLKSQEFIRDYLSRRKNCNFINVLDMDREWPKARWRTRWYFVKFNMRPISVLLTPLLNFLPTEIRPRQALRRKRVWPLPIKRSYPRGYRQYGGQAWYIFNRAFCEYVCFSGQTETLKRFYRHTYVPEEEFFQTVIMHSPFKETVINDSKRFVNWRNHTIKPFTIEDVDTLSESEAFFARKFDEAVDSRIIDYLEARVRGLLTGENKL